MTKHALAMHAPSSAVFAVSSYGPGVREGRPPAELRPLGLEAPLIWLANELERLDAELLDWLWDLAPDDLGRLSRCVKAFCTRHPRSLRREGFESRLAAAKRAKRGKRLAQAATLLAASAIGLAGYDWWGFSSAIAFEKQPNQSPGTVARHWHTFEAWHPTIKWLWPSKFKIARDKSAQWTVAEAEDLFQLGKADPNVRLRLEALVQDRPDLRPKIAKAKIAEERTEQERSWAQIRAESSLVDKSLDPDRALALVQNFLRSFPDSPRRTDALSLASQLHSRALVRRETADRRILDSLDRGEKLPSVNVEDLLDQARTYIAQHPESPLLGEFEARVAGYARKIDDRDFQRAKDYSGLHPTQFSLRIQKYQDYLKAHASGGKFISESLKAKDAIAAEWDVYSYRQVYDHASAHGDDVFETARGLREYLLEHPDGKFAREANDYLSWFDKISTPHDYHVTLRRGIVESDVHKYFSGGARISRSS